MSLLSLLSVTDLQHNLASYVRTKRKQLKLSRQELAIKSTVPASTIKKFETSGQVSLRQFLLIWQSIDDLENINQLTKPAIRSPKSIDEVLQS